MIEASFEGLRRDYSRDLACRFLAMSIVLGGEIEGASKWKPSTLTPGIAASKGSRRRNRTLASCGSVLV
jgi:hypothetical protein